MRERRAVVALTALLAACGGPSGGGGTASPSAAASPPPRATAAAMASRSGAPTPTAVPIHVRSQGAGGQNVTIVESRNGRRIYDVTAKSSEAQTGAAGATARLEAPHIAFHDRSRKTTTADAPEATVTERDKSVVMTGGVRARSQAGAVLTCDRLRYDGGSETFHGDGNVTLRSPGGLVLTGDTIDGDLKLENVKVRGRAPA